jgi:hypothetical protein
MKWREISGVYWARETVVEKDGKVKVGKRS